MRINLLTGRVLPALFVACFALMAAAAPDGQRLAQIKNADTDGNKRVTFEEFQAAFPELDRSAFDLYDKNEDGVLTREDISGIRDDKPNRSREPKTRLLAMLRQADTDSDGKVTFEEITAVAPGITRAQFDRFDRNGDGFISEADRGSARPPTKPGANFREIALRADKDGNGEITLEELRAEVPEITQERFSRFDRNGDGVLSRTDGEVSRNGSVNARRARVQITQKVLEADEDGDGKVTFEEVSAIKPGFPRAAFDRYDVNSDGFLSSEDLPDEAAE